MALIFDSLVLNCQTPAEAAEPWTWG